MRTLKTFGLALVAMFAMSAVVVSAAQAVQITTGASPAILTTEALNRQTFVVNGTAEVSCENITGKATIENGDSSVTFQNVAYSGDCTATIGGTTLPATVDMTGCDYKFHGGSGSEGHFTGGQVDLVCSGTTGPDIYIYQNAEHTTKVCTYQVWAFTNHGEITYKNAGGSPDNVDLRAINVGVPTTRTQGILCPKPSGEAVYNGEVTVRAFEDNGGSEGSQVSLTAS